MLKNLMAVIAAAVGAGMIVALIPPPGEAIAARTPQSGPADAGKLAGAPAARGATNIRKPACTQHWPYYEQACLSDLRQPNGNARAARLITGNLQLYRALHARR